MINATPAWPTINAGLGAAGGLGTAPGQFQLGSLGGSMSAGQGVGVSAAPPQVFGGGFPAGGGGGAGLGRGLGGPAFGAGQGMGTAPQTASGFTVHTAPPGAASFGASPFGAPVGGQTASPAFGGFGTPAQGAVQSAFNVSASKKPLFGK